MRRRRVNGHARSAALGVIAVGALFAGALSGGSVATRERRDARAVRAAKEHDIPPSPGERDGQEGGEADAVGARGGWFRAQRAYPQRTIPVGALERAQQSANRLPRVLDRRVSARGPVVGTWNELGPRPMTGPPGLYNGTGPWGGRVSSIANDPTNVNIAYVGAASGGVWKTTNGGVSWTPTFDTQGSLPIGDVTVAPSNPSVVYAGTGEGNHSGDSYYGFGVYRSTDGAATWTKVPGAQFDSCHTGEIAISPIDPNVVFVATMFDGGVYGADPVCSGGVWRTSNGGTTWTRVLARRNVQSVSVKPGTPTTFFAGVNADPFAANPSDGVYRSIDNGVTWAKLAGGLPTTGFDRVQVVAAPSNGNRLYAAFVSTTTFGALQALMTSADGGNSWTALAAPPDDACSFQCWYNLTLAADPTNPAVLWFGGNRFYQYAAGTWTEKLAFDAGVHVDFHALSFDATKRLWIGNDGGVYRTTGNATTFTNLNATLGATQMYYGMSGSLNGPLLIGTQDNGSERYKGTKSWYQVSGGDGGPTAIDPTTPSTWYVTAQELQVFEETNNGAAINEIDGGIDTNDPRQFIAPIAVGPTTPTKLYAGTNRLWRTADGGTTWNAISPAFTGSEFGCCITAIAPSTTPSTIYVGIGEGGVRVTTNDGASWVDTTANGLPARWVTDLWVNPANAQEVVATVSGYGSGHVFRTTNGGATWSNVTGNLPDAPTNSVAVDTRTAPATLYVASDVGVFTTTNLGGTWARFGSGLPNTIVSDLLLDVNTNRLVAGTYGRGAWAAFVATALPGVALVDVADAAFVPATATVALGKRVIWSFPSTNTLHHGTSAGLLGLWNSGTRSGGAAFYATLKYAGTYSVTDVTTTNASTVAVAPTATPATGTTATGFTVKWATTPAAAGYVLDVQVSVNGAAFAPWKTGVTLNQATYSATTAGTYRFQARVRRLSNGVTSLWSPSATVTVT